MKKESHKKVRLTDKELNQQLAPLRRKEALLKPGCAVMAIAVVAFLAFVVYGMIADVTLSFLEAKAVIAFAVTVVGLVMVIIGYLYGKKIKALIKDNVIPCLLEKYFEDVKYEQDLHIDEKLLKESKLFSGWERSKGRDYIEATHNGVSFTFSNVLLYYEETQTTSSVDSDGNSTTTTTTNEVTVFKGQWVIIDGAVHKVRDNKNYLFDFLSKETNDLDALRSKFHLEIEQIIEMIESEKDSQDVGE